MNRQNALSFTKFRNKFSHEFFMRIGDFFCVCRERSSRDGRLERTGQQHLEKGSILLLAYSTLVCRNIALLGRFNFEKGRIARKTTKWHPLSIVPGPAPLVATCHSNVSAFYQFSNLHKKPLEKSAKTFLRVSQIVCKCVDWNVNARMCLQLVGFSEKLL